MHAHAYAGSSLPPLPARLHLHLQLGMTGNGNGGRGACAVCKHQRRKCEPNCELAAYFPAHRMNDFRALHLVFGVANLTKLIKANASEASQRRAAETLTWEARWRERDPSEGCYREVSCLRRDNDVLCAENAALRRQLAEQQHLLLWSTAAAGTGTGTGSALQMLNANANANNGLLTARPHHAPAAHTMLAYRGMPMCTTTANGSGRRTASDASAMAVRGGGGHGHGQVDSSCDHKSIAR